MFNLDALSGSGIGGDSSASKPKNDVGQQDFLKLMIAQMQNQDPFAPMENGEFLTQIAQFTSASGINELQESFQRFQQDMAGDQALRAAGLVGREVLVESDRGYLPAEGALTGVVKAPQSLANLTIGIYNEIGELVREIPMGQQPSGDIPFQWDGLSNEGQSMPEGRYKVAAHTTIDGQAVTLSTLAGAKVESVHLKTGQSPVLSLEGLGELSLAAVRQIK